MRITGKVYRLDHAAFDDLLTVTLRLRPAIEAGISQVLPAFPDSTKRFQAKSLGLTSANFHLEELLTQFNEFDSDESSLRTSSGLSHLLLPHFSRVPIERILEIREKESDLYAAFQRRMENMLRGASQTDSETRILEYLRDVDMGVRELHRKFQDVQKLYKRRNIEMLVKFIAAGMVVLSPLDVAAKASIASILGGISAFDYMTTKREEANSHLELQSDKFYLPWLIFRAGLDNVTH